MKNGENDECRMQSAKWGRRRGSHGDTEARREGGEGGGLECGLGAEPGEGLVDALLE